MKAEEKKTFIKRRKGEWGDLNECCKLTSFEAELILLLALIVIECTYSHFHCRRGIFIKWIGVSICISGREGIVGLLIRPICRVALVFLIAANAENRLSIILFCS